MKLIGKAIIFVSACILVFVSYSIVVYRYSGTPEDSMEPEGQEKGKGQVKIIRKHDFSSVSGLREWDIKKLAKNSTDYTVTKEDGRDSVKAVSKNSASALFLKKRFSTERDPVVSWYWKASKFPSRQEEEVLDKKEEFDFVAQVYVIFHAKFFLNTKAIQYVWTEEIPVGTTATSPYTGNVRLLVLESGPHEEWKYEERYVAEDFMKLFGEKLDKDIEAISFMTDADSTGTEAVAYFSDFTLGYKDDILEQRNEAGSENIDDTQAGGDEWYYWVENIPFLGEYIKKLK